MEDDKKNIGRVVAIFNYCETNAEFRWNSHMIKVPKFKSKVYTIICV